MNKKKKKKKEGGKKGRKERDVSREREREKEIVDSIFGPSCLGHVHPFAQRPIGCTAEEEDKKKKEEIKDSVPNGEGGGFFGHVRDSMNLEVRTWYSKVPKGDSELGYVHRQQKPHISTHVGGWGASILMEACVD